MRFVFFAFLTASALASPAFGQAPPGTWNGLPDRFQIDTGYFGLNANTLLRYNGLQGAAGEVDFEQDLGLPEQVDTFWVDGTWRVGRRHQLKVGFTRFRRERDDVELQRDFTWGGETYNAGLTATSTSATDILGGYYRFAIVRNDRFEIGPTVGVGYLWLKAGIRATGSVTGPGRSETRTLDESASAGSVTGAVGGYASAWLTKRLVVQGDYLYISANVDDSSASVTDWRLAAYYYIFRNAGLGVQYKYNRYSYDRGILASQLGGELTCEGPQVFLSFRF